MTFAPTRSRRRAAAALAATCGGALATAGAAEAVEREPVSPVLECVAATGSETKPWTAYFGYNNRNADGVNIAAGAANKFTPGGDLGQPTAFEAGRRYSAFAVEFSGTLVWSLDGRTSTASDNPVQRCKSVDLAKTLLINGIPATPGQVATSGDAVSFRIDVTVTTPVVTSGYVVTQRGSGTPGGYPVLHAGSIELKDPQLLGDAALDVTELLISTPASDKNGPLSTPAVTPDTALYQGDVLTWTSPARTLTAADCATGVPANTASVDLIAKPFDAVERSTSALALTCTSTPETPVVPTPPTTPTTPVASAPPPAPANVSVAAAAAPVVAAAARRPVSTPRAAAGRARLAIDKTAPRRARGGQVVTYRITVRNSGTTPARSVIISDAVPSQLSLARPARGARMSAGTLTWRLGTIAPRGSRSVTVALRLDATASGTRCNTASAAAANAPRVADRACTSVTPVAARVEPAVTG